MFLIHSRLMTVYQNGYERYCVVEKMGKDPNGDVRVVNSRCHYRLTAESLNRVARVVKKHSLTCRPFTAGLVGYVAEMPAHIKEQP